MKKIDTGRAFKDTQYGSYQQKSSNNADTYSTRLRAGGKTYFTTQQEVDGGTRVIKGTSTDDGDKIKSDRIIPHSKKKAAAKKASGPTKRKASGPTKSPMATADRARAVAAAKKKAAAKKTGTARPKKR